MEVLVNFDTFDQVFVEKSYRANDRGFTDRVAWQASRPFEAGDQDHFENDFGVENDCWVEVLCLQEVLSQCKHIDAQFVVFLSVDTGGDDFEDFVPEVNNCGLEDASDLFSQELEALLIEMKEDYDHWDRHTPQRFIFDMLVRRS